MRQIFVRGYNRQVLNSQFYFILYATIMRSLYCSKVAIYEVKTIVIHGYCTARVHLDFKNP